LAEWLLGSHALYQEEAKKLTYPFRTGTILAVNRRRDPRGYKMGYLSRLNTMADHLSAEKSEIYKVCFKEDLRPFLRDSPLMAGIIARGHGYSGDFVTVRQFFQNPYCRGRQSLHRDEGEIEAFVPPEGIRANCATTRTVPTFS
jgi:hypothetical protein